MVLEDNDPLCCCEYTNVQGERAHLCSLFLRLSGTRWHIWSFDHASKNSWKEMWGHPGSDRGQIKNTLASRGNKGSDWQCYSFGARSGNVYFCFAILVDTSPCTWHGATPFDILQVPNVSAILSAPDKILCYVEPSNIRFPILHLSVSCGGNSILAQNCLTNRESNSHR